jgi:hypothetical protein
MSSETPTLVKRVRRFFINPPRYDPHIHNEARKTNSKVSKVSKVSEFSDYGAPSVEGMEPQWTRHISSTTVCDWFYIFFIFNAIFVALLVFTIFSGLKGGVRARLIQVLPAAIIGAVNVLFWYLMCDRALLQ